MRKCFTSYLMRRVNQCITGSILATIVGISAATAQAPQPADLERGLNLYQEKGSCKACHGWAGDGRKADNQMPDGANLRESQLDRDTLIQVILCGRPRTSMPAFDRLAYSDGRCYGMTQADLRKAQIRMFDAPATLQRREVEAIVDFMLARMVGRGPMTAGQCVEFWGGPSDACGDLPK